MEQNPIFIPLDGITQFPEPMSDPDHAGLTDLEPKPLHGYRCPDIKATYMWQPNGAGKGFTQTLLCRYDGPEPRFNHLVRTLQNRESPFIVLLPRPGKPYIIVGTLAFDDIEVGCRAVEHQTFVLECCYNLNPFPYFPGPVDIVDVTEPELMDALFGKRLKEGGV